MMNAVPKKVMIMAGGTGGHVFPALAVAHELISRGCEIQWLGTDRGIESRLVPEHGIVLNCLEISGVRGKGLKSLLMAPMKIFSSILQARKVLNTFKPDVVLGMGGYASGPGGIAAWLLRIPLAIHEQNARAGTTNKWLAHFANRIMTAFPDVLPKGEWIGNPVRADIFAIADPEQRFTDHSKPLKILVLGGSLGAKAINELMPIALADWLRGGLVELQHQTGSSHIDSTLNLYQTMGLRADVKPFIDDMAKALSWADLVVCRSGALTVSELSVAGVPSILIPFPFAIDDHQTANANWLVSVGAAYLQPQQGLTVKTLQDNIQLFMSSRLKVLQMAKAARSVSKPKATIICANICQELANG